MLLVYNIYISKSAASSFRIDFIILSAHLDVIICYVTMWVQIRWRYSNYIISPNVVLCIEHCNIIEYFSTGASVASYTRITMYITIRIPTTHPRATQLKNNNNMIIIWPMVYTYKYIHHAVQYSLLPAQSFDRERERKLVIFIKTMQMIIIIIPY